MCPRLMMCRYWPGPRLKQGVGPLWQSLLGVAPVALRGEAPVPGAEAS